MQPTEGKNNNFCLKYIYETTVQQNSESDLNAALDLWPCGSVWHCSHWNYFVSAKCKISSQDSNGHMIIPQQFIREEVWLVAFIEYFNFTKHRGTAMVNILVIMVKSTWTPRLAFKWYHVTVWLNRENCEIVVYFKSSTISPSHFLGTNWK